MSPKLSKILSCFLVIFLLLQFFCFLPKPQIARAVVVTVLTNVTDTPTSTKISTSTSHKIDFTTYTTVPADGKIVITFPAGFNVAAVAFSAWSGFDGDKTVSTSSQTVTITRTTGGTASVAGGKYITLSGITNTATAGTNNTVTVETQDSTGATLDGPTTSYYFSICANACHTATYQIPWSSTVSTTGKHTTKFTTATSTPADAKIKITFPSGFDVSAATFSTSSDFDGGFNLSINSQTITLTRDGTGTATSSGAKYVILNNITNHSTASSTYYVTLETTYASDVNIEGPTGIRFSINDTGLGLADSSWPIRRHDLKATGHSPYSGPSYPTVKWVYDAGVAYESSPIVGSDGTIYVDSLNGYVRAINPNGSLKWELAAGTNFRGTPALGGDGTIYTNWDYSTGLNGSGDRMYAINSNGTKKWSFSSNVAGEGVGLPIVGSDGTVYMASKDNNLYAINPDGTKKWGISVTNGGMWTYCGMGDDGIIYVGSYDSVVYGVNTGGIKVFTSGSVGNLASGVPTIAADGSIYITNYGYQLYALDSDGSVKWSYANGPTRNFSSVALADSGVLYFNSYNGKALVALNTDGTTRWTYPNPAGTVLTGSPIVGQDGIIYFNAAGTNKAYALNSDGSFRWSYNKTGSGGNSTPAIDSNGILYSVANDGTQTGSGGFYAFQPWTLSFTLNSSGYYNPGDTISFTAVSSMLTADPISSEANRVQVRLSNGDIIPLTYSSANSSGNTVWTGAYAIPAGALNGAYTATAEAVSVNVQTDTALHFASYPTNSNNTGITSSLNYTISSPSGIPTTLVQISQPSPSADNPQGGFRIIINDDAVITNTRDVILKLYATPAIKNMAISESPYFTGSQIQPYQATTTWTLSQGDGLKTVYVIFYNQYGVMTDKVYDTITFTAQTPQTTTESTQTINQQAQTQTQAPSPTAAGQPSSPAPLSGAAIQQIQSQIVIIQQKLVELLQQLILLIQEQLAAL